MTSTYVIIDSSQIAVFLLPFSLSQVFADNSESNYSRNISRLSYFGNDSGSHIHPLDCTLMIRPQPSFVELPHSPSGYFCRTIRVARLMVRGQ